MEIKKITKTIYVDEDGNEFESEDEARGAIVVKKLDEMLQDASYWRDYITSDAAKYLYDRKDELIKLLSL